MLSRVYVVSFCALIASCADLQAETEPHDSELSDPDTPIGTIEHALIKGTLVTPGGQQELGLVEVATSLGGCSGTLLNESWVLTAGHCFAQSERYHVATVTFLGTTRTSDLVYVFGSETNGAGMPTERGYDLALIRVESPLSASPFRQKPIFDSGSLAKQWVNFFGQGINAYSTSTMPTSGSGVWRQVSLQIDQQVSRRFDRNANGGVRSPWEDGLIAHPNSAGQICGPGDSGGPLFSIDQHGQAFLAGIISAGNWTCTNQTSVANCKATITNISSCFANMIPATTVRALIETSWNPKRATEVMNVTEEMSYQVWGSDQQTGYELTVDKLPWDAAARAANEMCFNRGFAGGHLTGNHGPGSFELACSSPGAAQRTATVDEIATTSSPFFDLSVSWAASQRAASELCARESSYGFAGGHFNGFQREEGFGLICYGAPGQRFDATRAEIDATGWSLGDLDHEPWDQAARAAHRYCETRGFASGFMTGHQASGTFGVVCQRPMQGFSDSTTLEGSETQRARATPPYIKSELKLERQPYARVP